MWRYFCLSKHGKAAIQTLLAQMLEDEARERSVTPEARKPSMRLVVWKL